MEWGKRMVIGKSGRVLLLNFVREKEKSGSDLSGKKDSSPGYSHRGEKKTGDCSKQKERRDGRLEQSS